MVVATVVVAVALPAAGFLPGVAAAGATATTATGATATATVGGSGIATGIATSGGNAIALAISAGPIGWFALGCTEENKEVHQGGGNKEVINWDCWKAVLHDSSDKPSKHGILIRDIICDKRIQHVSVSQSEDGNLPIIQVENIWNEKFLFDYVRLESTGEIAAHATRCY